MMRVLITGASGLIGSALIDKLEAAGHDVAPLVRGTCVWAPERGRIDLTEFGDIDAIVHLAGESIAEGRWTKRKKERILTSRIATTRLLVDYLVEQKIKPRVLVSASAIGFYGDRGDTPIDETAAVGQGFLPSVCARWEGGTAPAADAGIRVVNARFGVVLSRDGGVLSKMAPPFKLGLGGRIGDGRQVMSWVSIDDAVAMLLFILETESLKGPVNLVSPGAVTNDEFTRALGRAFGRPTPFAVPAFAARTIFGEMADALLLSGARVMPRVLSESGYGFHHPDLEAALAALLR